ncbi:hypothetical protein INT47_013237 [Mucor saturninus]|uniref:Uncharacterized protein n=1 Tax=Mucor saturninus TaxID=64648 RepID=A0A8H7R265_9FUNG|nr:hypothetical protein INT47_013237 [Mucor saturninus]
MQHPYQASVPTGKSIQQSLFPSWHDRRHTVSADSILEGNRKSGSFELLQGLVREKELEEQDKPLPSLPTINAVYTESKSSSVTSILVNKAEKKPKRQSRCVKFMEQ